jgi:hypothetical protein
MESSHVLHHITAFRPVGQADRRTGQAVLWRTPSAWRSLRRAPEGEKQLADPGMSLPRALFAVAPLVLAHQAPPRVSQLKRRPGRHRRSVRAVPAWRAGHGARLRVPPRRCPGGQSGATAHACVVSTDLELAGGHIRKIGYREADPQRPSSALNEWSGVLKVRPRVEGGGRRWRCPGRTITIPKGSKLRMPGGELELGEDVTWEVEGLLQLTKG